MPRFKIDQAIGQLEKRKGGYYFLKVDAEIVNQFEMAHRFVVGCFEQEILEPQNIECRSGRSL